MIPSSSAFSSSSSSLTHSLCNAPTPPHPILLHSSGRPRVHGDASASASPSAKKEVGTAVPDMPPLS